MNDTAIDLQSLLEQAKTQRIPLVAEEWIDTDKGGRFPATNEGRVAAEEFLVGHNVTNEYDRRRMIRWRQSGRPMYDIVKDLNERMKALGIEPQEGGFSFWQYDWYTPEEHQMLERNNMGVDAWRMTGADWDRLFKVERTRPLPLDYRWVAVYPVTGGSEGYYLHVDLIWQLRIEDWPLLKVMREMIARIEATPYDPHRWQKDRELLAKARTLLHGEPKEFRKMLALAKTWDWDNACACCAVAATLLGA